MTECPNSSEENPKYPPNTPIIKTPPSALIINVAEQLLNQAEEQYKTDQKFSDETLLSLNSIFGPVTVRALDLLENGRFVIYQSNDNARKVLKVKGSQSEEYTLFHRVNYCKCRSFKYNVVKSGKALTCKHVLAARLAEITGKFVTETYTPQQIAEILNNQI